MNERVKTPFVDMRNDTIHVGDILKHYHYVDDPNRKWEYDIGVVLPREESPEQEKYWWRTSMMADWTSPEKFILSNYCDYLIIGNTDEPRTDVAIRLWHSLSNQQKENYYYDNGIIGFLENFCITKNDEPLTDAEIEYALNEIMEQSIIE